MFFIKNFKRKHFEKIVELMYNNTQVGKVKYTEMRSYMFEVNEKVVYGVVGVCEIEQIGSYVANGNVAGRVNLY